MSQPIPFVPFWPRRWSVDNAAAAADAQANHADFIAAEGTRNVRAVPPDPRVMRKLAACTFAPCGCPWHAVNRCLCPHGSSR